MNTNQISIKELKQKVKGHDENNKVFVKFFDSSAKGGEGEYSEEYNIQKLEFDEDGDLIIHIND